MLNSLRNIIILNIYAPNNTTSKYIRQKLIKKKIKLDDTFTVVDFNMINPASRNQ